MKTLKILGWALGALLLVILLLAGVERMAAERVEVVELHTVNPTGEPLTTRLWIVDHEGHGYLRVGADGSGWFSRLTDNGEIELTRNGERQRYRAVPRPELSDAVNELMQAKYTWGDTFIGVLVGSRDNSVPIELQPINAG